MRVGSLTPEEILNIEFGIPLRETPNPRVYEVDEGYWNPQYRIGVEEAAKRRWVRWVTPRGGSPFCPEICGGEPDSDHQIEGRVQDSGHGNHPYFFHAAENLKEWADFLTRSEETRGRELVAYEVFPMRGTLKSYDHGFSENAQYTCRTIRYGECVAHIRADGTRTAKASFLKEIGGGNESDRNPEPPATEGETEPPF